jgi:translation initiation factor 1
MADETKPFHNPFAALRDLTGVGPAEPAAPEPAPPVPSAETKTIPRAVVRLERRGRGGKDVTVIEHLALREADREPWLAALKSALGCGGTLDDHALVLQGDQRTRLPDLLRARGVKKVTVA